MSDEVRCLCWNCGREILSDKTIYEINEELWCEDCASSYGVDTISDEFLETERN